MPGNILIDTNILFSFLLDQNDYKTTEIFFEKIDKFNISITILDFALYSVCIILTRRKENAYMDKFFKYLEKRKNFHIHKFDIEDLSEINSIKIPLDFDDKLHYWLAKKQNLKFVSYDKDFDKTDLKRFTPAEAIKTLGN